MEQLARIEDGGLSWRKVRAIVERGDSFFRNSLIIPGIDRLSLHPSPALHDRRRSGVRIEAAAGAPTATVGAVRLVGPGGGTCCGH